MRGIQPAQTQPPRRQQNLPTRVELSEEQQQAIQRARQQIEFVNQLLKSVLVRGVDYDTVPGSDKPTLHQPGAQLLCLILRVRPQIEVQSQRQLDPPFIAHTVVTRLVRLDTGEVVGEGVGSANSRERRFSTGRYAHRDPFDLDNTLLKMAAKRSLVHAVLNATAASRVFTQDLEEDLDEYRDETHRMDRREYEELIAECMRLAAENRHLVEQIRQHLYEVYGVTKPQELSPEKLLEFVTWLRSFVAQHPAQQQGQAQVGQQGVPLR